MRYSNKGRKLYTISDTLTGKYARLYLMNYLFTKYLDAVVPKNIAFKLQWCTFHKNEMLKTKHN